MLFTNPIPAIFNGISQQPATLRLPSQGEEQINAISTIADGMRKRSAFESIAKVSDDDLTEAFVHTIDRSADERYKVVLTDGDLKVYDFAGAAVDVSFPLSKSYLDIHTGTAKTGFACVTVADYTFIVNKTILVEMGAVGDDLTLPSDWSAFVNPWVTTDDAAPDLHYYNPARTYIGAVQTFADLPTAALTEGDLYRIAGLDTNGFGAYYARRTALDTWEESLAEGMQNRFDDFTMPWALIRRSDGTFVFQPFKWNVRKFGDDETNPPPSFVGNTINDVFFYKNRLGFASNESTVFSCAGDFGNFFRNTVTDLLDSDVVDTAASTNEVAEVSFAVPIDNRLMLFSAKTQFAFNTDQLLTPTSPSIDPVTHYNMNVNARPVAIGTDVYFVVESGNHSRVREYYVQDGQTNSKDAADVTAHVPRYVPSEVFSLAGNAQEDILFAISSKTGFQNRIYVYKFFWDENGKAQSSWSYWEHGDPDAVILSLAALEDEIYSLVKHADGVFLEKCVIQAGNTTGTLEFEILLDRLVEVTGTYDADTDRTTFVLPYSVPTDQRDLVQIARGGDFAAKGALVDPSQYSWTSLTTLHVDGDHSDGECHAGLQYVSSYEFSEQFMKNANGSAVTTGRTQLRTYTVYFTDTAFFKTYVAPYGEDALVLDSCPPTTTTYNGKTIGSAHLVLGEPSFHTGAYTFTVMGESKQAIVKLLNDSHVQSVFQSAEVEGFNFNRARSRQ